jgi:hypothetical protein
MKQLILFILSCAVFNQYSISQNSLPAINDIAVGPFLSLPENFFTTNNYTVKAKVTNAGTSAQVNVPVKFSVNGTQVGSGTIPNLPSGAIDSVSFTWAPPFSGFFTLRIYSALANDENRLNDTVAASFYVLPAGGVGSQITLCRHGLNKPIQDLSTVYDTINAGGFPCLVYDVNVLLDTILHTWVSDLVISIIHNNITDTLLNSQGGSGDNFIGVWLNDSATQVFPPQPVTGTFKPFRPLRMFNGYSYAGQWILKISDIANGDTGFLKAWCVQMVIQPCLGINSNNTEVPRNYFLSQNYPNPFNPTTTINYGIPVAGNVTLKVYDLLGREISTLVNEIKQPGIYSVNFDASNFASGVYIYKMETDGFTAFKKLSVIK